MARLDGVKVFSATKGVERENLGDKATEWLKANPHVEVTELKVVQSSDNAYHCLTLILAYRDTNHPQV